MNTVNIVDAISNKQYTAAEEDLHNCSETSCSLPLLKEKCRCQKRKKY